jgi:flagellin-like hook-associated protein FlgL
LSAVDTHQEQLTTRRLSSQGRLSKIEDVDLAEAVSGMSRADTAYRAALSSANQASRPSLIDFLK